MIPKIHTSAATLIDQRDGDEEAGEEAAPQPLHHSHPAPIASENRRARRDAVPGKRGEARRAPT